METLQDSVCVMTKIESFVDEPGRMKSKITITFIELERKEKYCVCNKNREKLFVKKTIQRQYFFGKICKLST